MTLLTHTFYVLPDHLSLYLSVYPIYLPTHLPCYFPVSLPAFLFGCASYLICVSPNNLTTYLPQHRIALPFASVSSYFFVSVV